MHDDIQDQRSGFDNENIQELLDAAVSAGHALSVGAQQYQTPPWLARGLASQLPNRHSPVFDPQCAGGNLLLALATYDRYGWDLDARFIRQDDTVKRLRGNCVKLAAILDDIDPSLRFPCIVANPPFGIRWKLPEGGSIDSTEWTWKFILSRLGINGSGFLISSKSTIERLGLHEHSWVYAYQTFPKGIWENTLVEIGVVHFSNWTGRSACPWPARAVRNWAHLPSPEEMEMAFRPPSIHPGHFYMGDSWRNLSAIASEESRTRPQWNIYLTERGILRTYLSTRNRLKLPPHHIDRLFRINDAHPLTLTTERETRKLLASVVEAGVYTIQPEALAAIQAALAEVASIACPIVPITDFEKVAYADEEETLKAKANGCQDIHITAGKSYELRTGTYQFAEKYYRTKLHWDDETDKTEIQQHECVLSGSDRFIEFTDDRGVIHRFMERPGERQPADRHFEHPESMLFQLFEEPTVPTVAEVNPAQYQANLDAMRFNERLNGFTYFEGQRDYYARMATKDGGLVAAAVGCHAAGTPIMMADGTTKLVEDIVPSDQIMGWDNTPRKVLQLTRGRQEMARIVPVKGEPFVVNLDHILTLVQTNMGAGRKMARTNGAVRDVTVREFLKWPKHWRDNHKLFRRPIELPTSEHQLVTPYFMGLYLGDGGSTSDQVGISKPDHEVQAAVLVECAIRGWDYRETATTPERTCPTHVIKGGGIRRVLDAYKLLGVRSGARFIPDQYLRGSRCQRLDLLAGILDSDGHLDICGTFDYISQSKRLADDVVWVARSLGLAAYVSPCEKRDQNGQGGTYYRVCISGDIDMIPTRLPRKQAKPRRQKKNVLRTGFSVELFPEDDFYGFTIEGDGRFLMGDFTVTHNTGKTVGALTLCAVKSPGRTIIIAPQGTMRSSEDEEEVEYQASQWVQEIQKFASSEPVFQLFNEGDWRKILHANGGVAPNGIYITYPQAYFSNGAFESIPAAWDRDLPVDVERKFCERNKLKFFKERPETEYLSDGVGRHEKESGIRCIASASLATIIATEMGEWDMVIIDEAHLCCNLDAQVTKNLIRLQPKYRFALTATPIPNIITNLFSLMGWLCVKDWYLGDRRNAAWPYAVTERGRFESTFLSWETDITQQQEAKAKGKKGWKNVGIRMSPIISSPARLLKLLKPTMAYISKEACNPKLVPCEIIDVRVPVGAEQAKLYNYWLERRHYLKEYSNHLTIARVQSSRLRGICGAPLDLDYNRILVPEKNADGEWIDKVVIPCRSNFNPKIVAMLKLVALCLSRGEQAVVVSARVGQSNEIARRLTEAGIPIARIDSTVSANLHTAEANRFKRGDARVMLMGIKCAQGHSFDGCPNLIIGSLEWSYGTLAQAQGRVWRLNSKKPVKVWVVLHENTIEEVLFDRVATKRDAATLCLHGRRVPRDFKPMDMAEILAEHIESYRAQTGKPESECESEWSELRDQIREAYTLPPDERMAA